MVGNCSRAITRCGVRIGRTAPARTFRPLRFASWEATRFCFARRGSDALAGHALGSLAHCVSTGERGRAARFDRVLSLPDGRLLVQIDSQLLLRGTLDDFLRGHFESEQVPTFFTDIEVAEGRVYGLGWDESGNVRAVFENAGRGWWLRARLPKEALNDSLSRLLVLDDGTPLAVSATRWLLPKARDSARSARSSRSSRWGRRDGTRLRLQCLRGQRLRVRLRQRDLVSGPDQRGHNRSSIRDGSVSAWHCDNSSPFHGSARSSTSAAFARSSRRELHRRAGAEVGGAVVGLAGGA